MKKALLFFAFTLFVASLAGVLVWFLTPTPLYNSMWVGYVVYAAIMVGIALRDIFIRWDK